MHFATIYSETCFWFRYWTGMEKGKRWRGLKSFLKIIIFWSFTGIYAGFAIFSVLGYMFQVKCASTFQEVVAAGAELGFKKFFFLVFTFWFWKTFFFQPLSCTPKVFLLSRGFRCAIFGFMLLCRVGIGLIKAVPPLWSTLFFLMMLALGFGSEFSIMETTMIMVIDIFKEQFNTRFKQILVRLAICIVYFSLGLIMATKVKYNFVLNQTRPTECLYGFLPSRAASLCSLCSTPLPLTLRSLLSGFSKWPLSHGFTVIFGFWSLEIRDPCSYFLYSIRLGSLGKRCGINGWSAVQMVLAYLANILAVCVSASSSGKRKKMTSKPLKSLLKWQKYFEYLQRPFWSVHFYWVTARWVWTTTSFRLGSRRSAGSYRQYRSRSLLFLLSDKPCGINLISWVHRTCVSRKKKLLEGRIIFKRALFTPDEAYYANMRHNLEKEQKLEMEASSRALAMDSLTAEETFYENKGFVQF